MCPDRATGHAIEAMLLDALGRAPDATQSVNRAIHLAPGDVAYRHLASQIAFSDGDPGLARRHAEAALCLKARDPRALSDLVLALVEVGDTAGALRLMDLDDLVRVYDIATPKGFDSVEAFNQALVAAFDARATALSTTAPTLVGGVRAPDTFAFDAAIAAALNTTIRAVLARYLADIKAPANHPVRLGQPAVMDIVSWTNAMPAGAFERPHIHDAAWISGVFYPEMPPGLKGPAGALVLGAHPKARSRAFPHPHLTLSPRPGQIVLFPAYVYHQTIPFEGPGRRVSVAFDIREI